MRASPRRFVLAVATLALVAGHAFAADLTVLCAGAMKAPVSAILEHDKATLPTISIAYATAGAIRERIAAGERPDLVIVPGDDMTKLLEQKLVDVTTRRPLGLTSIGIAVRAGAPKPDISTPDAVRAALLAARKVVIVDPAKGTSGRAVIGVFRDLGIADAMREKTIQLDGGYVVEAVARGEADLGLHQISEILPVQGIALVGPLPGALERLTRYDAAILGGTTHRPEADVLLLALLTDEARETFARSGFTPAR